MNKLFKIIHLGSKKKKTKKIGEAQMQQKKSSVLKRTHVANVC